MHILRRSVWLPTLIVTLICAAGKLRANEANYQDHIMGDRAAGMGGAACALGTAVDACYYNPAGLTFLKRNTVSISANLYGFQRYKADQAIYPDEDYTSDSFISIPSTMGGVFNMNDRVNVAFAAFIPNKYSMSELVAYPHNQHFLKFNYDDQTLWVGPSAAYQLTPEFSIGASLYGIYRTYNQSMSLFLGPEGISYSRYFKYNNVGALGQVGAQYRPTERLRLGLNLQSPSANVYGKGDFETDTTLNSQAGSNNGFLYAKNMDSENRIPPKVTLGCGWEKKQHYAVGVDLTYHGANSYNRLDGKFEDGTPAVVKMRNESVADINLGAEYYIQQKFPVRGGFFTSYSTAPDVNLNTDYPAQIDLYGFTASVGVETTNITSTIGMNINFGSGEDIGYEKKPDGTIQMVVVNAKEQNLYLFFTTSYMF